MADAHEQTIAPIDGLRADGISVWLRQAESGLPQHRHGKPL